jgi:hypothetical protein
MLRTELLVGFKSALTNAKKDNLLVHKKGLLLKVDGKKACVDLEIMPINPKSAAKDRIYLVLFVKAAVSLEKTGRTSKKTKPALASDKKRIRELMTELSELKLYQESIVEQYETTQGRTAKHE